VPKSPCSWFSFSEGTYPPSSHKYFSIRFFELSPPTPSLFHINHILSRSLHKMPLLNRLSRPPPVSLSISLSTSSLLNISAHGNQADCKSRFPVGSVCTPTHSQFDFISRRKKISQNQQARDDELIGLLTFLQENSIRTSDVSLIPEMRPNRIAEC
jgi:hypothetical protein